MFYQTDINSFNNCKISVRFRKRRNSNVLPETLSIRKVVILYTSYKMANVSKKSPKITVLIHIRTFLRSMDFEWGNELFSYLNQVVEISFLACFYKSQGIVSRGVKTRAKRILYRLMENRARFFSSSLKSATFSLQYKKQFWYTALKLRLHSYNCAIISDINNLFIIMVYP